MKFNDNEIQKTLAELQTIIKQIQKKSTREIEKSLTAKSQELATQLTAYSGTKFSHEFYENASELVEAITQMRLTPAVQKALVEMQLLAPLNELVSQIRTAVYKHEALRESTKPTSKSSSTNPITAAQQRAELAAQHSMEATAAAEKANNEGLKILEEIQTEQKTGGGLIKEELIKKSIDITLTMYAKNAAAVLAADEATAAMLELKELVNKK